MSPHINSLVGDLVAMAQAMERVPQLEQELTQVKLAHEGAVSHNQALELSIISYKQQIEDLHSKVRSLEVERDDASFRVLEAEDQNHAILNVARVAQANLSVILATLDPPKPQPEPEKEPDHVAIHKWDDVPKDQSVDYPTPASTVEGSHVASNAGTLGTASSEEAPKSDANPPTTVNDGDKKSEQTSVISSANSVATSDKSEDKEPSDKYSDEWYDWRIREDKRLGYHHF